MMTTTNTTTKQRKRTQSSSILLSLRILVFIASSFSFCSADVQQLEENDDVLPVRSRQFKQSKWQKHDDALLLGRRRHPPLPTGLRRASGLRPVPIDEKGIDEEVNVLPLSETEKRQLEEASRNLAEQQCNKECGLVIPGTPGGLGRRV
jgi:hypothetical protein